MFYNYDLSNSLAKRLAMLGNQSVPLIVNAISNESNAPEITGAVIGMMPHLMEKAIVLNKDLPSDVSLKLCGQFIKEFEALLKIISNAGGFSNPVKKALFNASFHTMFSCEYKTLKPNFEALWEMGREQQINPIDFITYGLI